MTPLETRSFRLPDLVALATLAGAGDARQTGLALARLDADARAQVLRYCALRPSVVAWCLLEGSAADRAAFARSQYIDHRTTAALAADPDPDVRAAVFSHHRTPGSLRRRVLATLPIAPALRRRLMTTESLPELATAMDSLDPQLAAETYRTVLGRRPLPPEGSGALVAGPDASMPRGHDWFTETLALLRPETWTADDWAATAVRHLEKPWYDRECVALVGEPACPAETVLALLAYGPTDDPYTFPARVALDTGTVTPDDILRRGPGAARFLGLIDALDWAPPNDDWVRATLAEAEVATLRQGLRDAVRASLGTDTDAWRAAATLLTRDAEYPGSVLALLDEAATVPWLAPPGAVKTPAGKAPTAWADFPWQLRPARPRSAGPSPLGLLLSFAEVDALPAILAAFDDDVLPALTAVSRPGRAVIAPALVLPIARELAARRPELLRDLVADVERDERIRAALVGLGNAAVDSALIAGRALTGYQRAELVARTAGTAAGPGLVADYAPLGAPVSWDAVLEEVASGQAQMSVLDTFSRHPALPEAVAAALVEAEPQRYARLLPALSRPTALALLPAAARMWARLESSGWTLVIPALAECLRSGALTPDDLLTHAPAAPFVLWAFGDEQRSRKQLRPLAEPLRALVDTHLGEDPDAWTIAMRLVPDFAGSVDELLATAARAAGRS
ncbi:hypothetical protein [Yinghuangia seranimata]|uniref:hypothetical protein n=1 Tax=Yinghuangia seranimata TaxID=408067 RepID=UPI00248C1BAF|nr:hypothetical protein [Yinghuangia seranimata]MDI2125817.1 hypothetical protein [Yinghuangia seranimata]